MSCFIDFLYYLTTAMLSLYKEYKIRTNFKGILMICVAMMVVRLPTVMM